VLFSNPCAARRTGVHKHRSKIYVCIAGIMYHLRHYLKLELPRCPAFFAGRRRNGRTVEVGVPHRCTSSSIAYALRVARTRPFQHLKTHIHFLAHFLKCFFKILVFLLVLLFFGILGHWDIDWNAPSVHGGVNFGCCVLGNWQAC
jgi:hypothetical protein